MELNACSLSKPNTNVKMMCRTCRKGILLIPIKNRNFLYKKEFNFPVLIQLILDGHQFFLCQQCCEVLSQAWTICTDFVKSYKCFVCARLGVNPPSNLDDVGSTLSGFDSCVRTKKHICSKCMVLFLNLCQSYKYLQQQNFPQYFLGGDQITSYLCEAKTLNVPNKKLELCAFQHPIKSINVPYVDYLMRTTSVYKRGLRIIQSTPYFTSIMCDLKSKRTIFKWLAEVTRYVKIRFKNRRNHVEENSNDNEDDDDEDDDDSMDYDFLYLMDMEVGHRKQRRNPRLKGCGLLKNVATQDEGTQHNSYNNQSTYSEDEPCCSYSIKDR